MGGHVLESCGYHPKIGIDNLINKSLITIFGKKLWLHDLLEEMGREIVRRESFEEPGRRSRLWFWEDILHVLKNNTVSASKEYKLVFLHMFYALLVFNISFTTPILSSWLYTREQKELKA